MAKRTVREIALAGKRVFVRVDFNVPQNGPGEILDDTKIRAALPTIRYLLDQGAAVILASHLGRPKGRVQENLRLDAIRRRVAELLGRDVQKTSEVVGETVTAAAAALQPGKILLLENVRFHPGEEKNDPELARAYASLAEIFVSDAFGTAHRAHASNVGIAAFLPAVAGLLLAEEVSNLDKALLNPDRPLVAVAGGNKVADKIGILKNLLHKAESLLLGGGMANTFLHAKGCQLGRSKLEESSLAEATALIAAAADHGVNLCLPADVVVAEEAVPGAQAEVVPVNAVPPDKMALDIGPATRRQYSEIISGAGTVIWNGPLGVYEIEQFAAGTNAIARAIAASGAFSIVAGGDAVAAVEKAGVAAEISHLSTGGGATLEYWEGRELPGIAVLQDN
ncbi:MAG: Phosphoglycerate kinase [Syntrophomonadaceae bacterium]|nr:Phosphoglycerate kinase [Bacillota bacterium]